MHLRQARWTTMMFLHRGGGGLFQRELAELMSINQPSLVRMLDVLEAQHLIQRHPDPRDRRVQQLHLAQQGEALVAQIGRHAERLNQTLLEGLTDDELAATTRVLQKMLDNAERRTASNSAALFDDPVGNDLGS